MRVTCVGCGRFSDARSHATAEAVPVRETTPTFNVGAPHGHNLLQQVGINHNTLQAATQARQYSRCWIALSSREQMVGSATDAADLEQTSMFVEVHVRVVCT